jgi:hypothetical protein
MRKVIRAAAIAAAAFVLCACATNYAVTPIGGEGQEVRFAQGIPTTFSDHDRGAVQVSPLGVSQDNQRLLFGVAAFNKSNAPGNLGVENVSASTPDGQPIKVFSVEELVAEARNRAMWQAIGVAVAGGAAAISASQNAYRTTNGTVITPRGGVYTYTAQTYDPTAAAIGTAAAGAATGVALVSIKNSLDSTIGSLRGNGLQTTTIDPGGSYGGEVMAASVPGNKYPQDVVVTVRFNGEEHAFRYNIAVVK